MVCAAQNRRLEEAPGKLFELPEVLATEGSHTLNVMQQGGRAARQARMFISYSEVSIKNPDNSGQALLLTYVCCREQAEDRCLLASAEVRKSGECRRCATYRQPLRATLADRGIPQGVEKWWYMCGIAANADPG